MMAVYDVPVDAGFWTDINEARDQAVQDDPGNGSESDSGYVRAAGGRFRETGSDRHRGPGQFRHLWRNELRRSGGEDPEQTPPG